MGNLREDLCTLTIILFSWNVTCFRKKLYRKIIFSENRVVYKIMGGKYGRARQTAIDNIL